MDTESDGSPSLFMRYRVGLIVVVILAALGGIVSWYGVWIFSHGELAEKPLYATLQGAEIGHRADTDRTSVLLIENAAGTGYTVLGVPTAESEYSRTWVILNATGPDEEVMFLPKARFALACQYVSKLKSQVQISPAVLRFLISRCST
jgi:hypothetical protein